MKSLLLISVLSIIGYAQSGILPASTTLLRQSTSIAHPPAIAYSQQTFAAPIAVSYSAPIAYSHSIAPTVYSQAHLAPAHYYSSPFYAHGPLVAQQSIVAQYPGLIAQSPVAAQYPIASAPVFGQLPIQGGFIQGPSQSPIEGGSPIIEAADNPQVPQGPSQQQPISQGPPQQQPIPQGPPQQSPVLGGGSGGTTFDDDTVSVEAA